MQLFMLSGLGIGNPHQWNYASWTVSSEFAAYLFYPILAIFVGRLNSRKFFNCNFFNVFTLFYDGLLYQRRAVLFPWWSPNFK